MPVPLDMEDPGLMEGDGREGGQEKDVTLPVLCQMLGLQAELAKKIKSKAPSGGGRLFGDEEDEEGEEEGLFGANTPPKKEKKKKKKKKKKVKKTKRKESNSTAGGWSQGGWGHGIVAMQIFTRTQTHTHTHTYTVQLLGTTCLQRSRTTSRRGRAQHSGRGVACLVVVGSCLTKRKGWRRRRRTSRPASGAAGAAGATNLVRREGEQDGGGV